MLELIRIKNIAVIDFAEVPFRPGLNILSGETGAGKSIIIEAISLLLGSRANTDLIRSHCDEAVVEGLFDLDTLPLIQQRLERLGFPADSSQLLIKRTVHCKGKHRIFVNGEMATLATLQELCEGLVDLCGQHEHQSLLKPSTQLELLDRYGNSIQAAEVFGNHFRKWRTLREEQTALSHAETERLKREDFLKFQIEELRSAKLSPGEDQDLQSEKQLLQSAESRVQTAESVRQTLESSNFGNSEEVGALNLLQAALTKIRTLAQLDPKTIPIRDILERALLETEAASQELSRYLNSIEVDPERLEQIQDRLSLIASLRKKYGQTLPEILAALNVLEHESENLQKTSERLAQIAAELESTLESVKKQARQLMLAIRRIIADRGGIGVYLFDEIDAGIGGQTAFQVGKKLKSVAKFNQVLCITHLPQVASFADHHLSVRKRSEGKRTFTEIVALVTQERKEELARMLGGPKLTRKSLENASELLEMAGEGTS